MTAKCKHLAWEVTTETRTEAGWLKHRVCEDCGDRLDPITEKKRHFPAQPGTPPREPAGASSANPPAGTCGRALSTGQPCPDHPTTPPTALDALREAARRYLAAYAGNASPAWRTCFSTNGSDEPTGVAPACTSAGHDEDDGSVYDCCPEPVIETGSYALAAYLVALLAADLKAGDPA